MLDGTVVNVALPTIGRHLNASLGGLQWIVTGYTLALAGLILLGGALGDRLGRRRVFLIGVAWFALASALCGLAPDIGVLIAARVLQGSRRRAAGARLAGHHPGQLRRRPTGRRAVGAWSGLGGVAGAAGPLLGGWIVEAAGWRWVFLLNLPLAVVVIAVTIRHVPETRDASASRPVRRGGRGARRAGPGRADLRADRRAGGGQAVCRAGGGRRGRAGCCGGVPDRRAPSGPSATAGARRPSRTAPPRRCCRWTCSPRASSAR